MNHANLYDRPKEAGIFRDTIQVNVEGQSLLKNIDVSATSVDFFVFVIDSNGALSQNFDFGDIYFGQPREIEAYLVNNSPQKYNFKAKFLTGIQNVGDEVPNLQTPNELGQEQLQRVMNCYPAEGFIESYAQVIFNKQHELNKNRFLLNSVAMLESLKR